jgi:hypothetical protein
MSPYGRPVVWFDCFDIYLRQSIEAMAVVAVEWERLEFFKHSCKSLTGWPFIVREPEFFSAYGFYVMQFVVSAA